MVHTMYINSNMRIHILIFYSLKFLTFNEWDYSEHDIFVYCQYESKTINSITALWMPLINKKMLT